MKHRVAEKRPGTRVRRTKASAGSAFTGIAGAIPVPVLVLDRAGRLSKANTPFLEFLGAHAADDERNGMAPTRPYAGSPDGQRDGGRRRRGTPAVSPDMPLPHARECHARVRRAVTRVEHRQAVLGICLHRD